VAVTVSMATMIAYSARMHTDHVDPVAVGRYWSARGEDLFRACAEDRHLLPDAQTIDVRFDEFMADDVAMVQRIYDVAGQPFTTAAGQGITAFMDTHQRGRHGTVVYQPEVLGIDIAERRRALSFYGQAFAVEPESDD
jgi:hypothetical protein